MDDLIERNRVLENMNFNGGCGICFRYVQEADSVEAVPLEPLCVWLAAYAAPPQYALAYMQEHIPHTTLANDLTEAWKYHFRELLKSGLMDMEGEDGEK